MTSTLYDRAVARQTALDYSTFSDYIQALIKADVADPEAGHSRVPTAPPQGKYGQGEEKLILNEDHQVSSPSGSEPSSSTVKKFGDAVDESALRAASSGAGESSKTSPQGPQEPAPTPPRKVD